MQKQGQSKEEDISPQRFNPDVCIIASTFSLAIVDCHSGVVCSELSRTDLNVQSLYHAFIIMIVTGIFYSLLKDTLDNGRCVASTGLALPCLSCCAYLAGQMWPIMCLDLDLQSSRSLH